ncbi:MAG: hypothetical protein ACXAC5_04025 [Promethearchaeota archaeon]
MVLHSPRGFNSVQEMVEAIARAFKAAIDEQAKDYWGNCFQCCMDRRKGIDICTRCGKSTEQPEVTKESVERIMEDVFNGTMQNLGDAWDTLQQEGIQSFGCDGNIGQVVSICSGPEIIVNTIFGDFSRINTETLGKCSSVELYKK